MGTSSDIAQYDAVLEVQRIRNVTQTKLFVTVLFMMMRIATAVVMMVIKNANIKRKYFDHVGPEAACTQLTQLPLCCYTGHPRYGGCSRISNSNYLRTDVSANDCLRL